jgi:hypothetical protein
MRLVADTRPDRINLCQFFARLGHGISSSFAVILTDRQAL